MNGLGVRLGEWEKVKGEVSLNRSVVIRFEKVGMVVRVQPPSLQRIEAENRSGSFPLLPLSFC